MRSGVVPIGRPSEAENTSYIHRVRSEWAPEVRAYVAELEATQAFLRREIDRLSIYRRLAFRDDLTGLYNRRHFEERLEQEWSRASRYDEDLSLLLIDLDGFKRVNDHSGHAAGDQVLAFVGQHLGAACRSFDVPCRIGGDEFALIMPECDVSGARAFIERCIARMSTSTDAPVLPAGVSFGLSFGIALRRDARSAQELFEVADGAMYAQKRARKSEGAPSSDFFAA